MKLTWPATKPTTCGVYADRKKPDDDDDPQPDVVEAHHGEQRRRDREPDRGADRGEDRGPSGPNAFERSTDSVPSTTQNPWSSRSSPAMRSAAPIAIPGANRSCA